jgi:uncharacterized protein YeeX (DUF496 family)
MSKNAVKPIMFMLHLALSQLDDVVEELTKKASLGDYVIAYEDKPYEHMHLVVHMNETDYLAFSSKMKNKYKLATKATKGARRQIGRVKTIRDLNRAYAYTLKENNENWIRTNMTKEKINDYIAESFKKENGDKIADWLASNPPETALSSGYQINEPGNHHYTQTPLSAMQFKHDIRWYFTRMFKAIGHQEKMKYYFYQNCLKLKYIDEYDYCMLVYKV